jgi:hypothetical protein
VKNFFFLSGKREGWRKCGGKKGGERESEDVSRIDCKELKLFLLPQKERGRADEEERKWGGDATGGVQEEEEEKGEKRVEEK